MAQEQFVKTYDPKDVIVTYGGREITGFDDDSIISIEASDNIWTSSVGAKGEVSRSRNHASNLANVELSLKQTSKESNGYLTSCKEYDKRTGRGAKALSVKEKRTGAVFRSPAAWISEEPSMDYEGEAGARTWNMQAANSTYKQAAEDPDFTP